MSREIFQRAIDAWGYESQMRILQEEAAELSLAAAKFVREQNDTRLRDLASEIADVENMIEQVKIMMPSIVPLISEEKEFKIERLRLRLDEIDVNKFKELKRGREQLGYIIASASMEGVSMSNDCLKEHVYEVRIKDDMMEAFKEVLKKGERIDLEELISMYETVEKKEMNENGITSTIELNIDSSKGVAFVMENGEERVFGSKGSDWECEVFRDQNGVVLSKKMLYRIIGRDEDKESK